MRTKTYVYFPFFKEWESCAKGFIVHMRSEKTIRAYTQIMIEFFQDTRKDPTQYTRADVERYIARPALGTRGKGGPPSASLRNMRLVALKSFFAFASDWIVITDGKRERLLKEPPPTAGIDRAKTSKNHHKAFTEDEIKRLFAAIPTDNVRDVRNKAALIVFFWSARRREELMRLRYGDLQQRTLPNGRVITIYRFIGKGNGGDVDEAELPQPAVDAVNRYLEMSGRRDTIQPDDPLFLALGPDNKGGKPVDKTKPLCSETLSWSLKQYLKKAGLPDTYSLHSFRHSAALARYEASGHDVLAVMKLLKHSNLAVTTVYLEGLSNTEDTTAGLLMDKYGNL